MSNKIFPIAFISLNLFLFSLSFAQAKTITPLETTLKSNHSELSIWKINNVSIGTGFFISENLFITNFHVISPILKNENTIESIILSQEGTFSFVNVKKVLALSALYDLALLETKEYVSNYLSLRENPPEQKESLFLLGYSGMSLKKIKKIGDIFYENSQFYLFPVNYFSLSGTSGSPVLDDKGQVVGIAVSANLNILNVIKQNHLQEFITGNTGLDCSDFIGARSCLEREIENLKELAKKGLPSAQHELAYMYLSGKRTEQNFKTAFDWMQQAAEQGHIVAQENLAAMYYDGIGTEKNPKLAFDWMQQAAKQGSASAQDSLAFTYYKGEGVESNFEMVLYWLKQAIERGHVLAQYRMAYIHYSGEKIKKIPDIAFYWMQQAANNGFPLAQYKLAQMYDSGMGTEKNPWLGFQWLEQAANNGFFPAQRELDQMYDRGEGIEQNLEMVLYWKQKAIQNGFLPIKYD